MNKLLETLVQDLVMSNVGPLFSMPTVVLTEQARQDAINSAGIIHENVARVSLIRLYASISTN
jgi:hypothetical protein